MDQISELSAYGHGPEHHASSPRSGARPLALYAADRADEHFPAQVLRRETGFYLLHLGTAMAEGRKLVMRDGYFRFELEIISCEPHEPAGFAVGARVVACRKGSVRQEWRMPANQPARVTLLLSRKQYAARVRDSSPFGMGIEVPVELARDTAITVRTQEGFGYGEVRYCRIMPDGKYFVGLYLREYMPHPESFWQQITTNLRQTRITVIHNWRRLWHPATTR